MSTWEDGSLQPSLDYSVDLDPLSASVRNPFSEKKWKKFQLSSIFGSSTAAVKLHVLDLNMIQGGATFIDRWLVVLSMGSGQTRNMALDRYVTRHDREHEFDVLEHECWNMESNIPYFLILPLSFSFIFLALFYFLLPSDML